MMISGLSFNIIRKSIKHSYLKVHTSSSDIFVSVPLKMPLSDIIQLVKKNWIWIEKKKKEIEVQKKPIKKTYLNGEQHPYQGQLYPLCILTSRWHTSVTLSFDTIVLSLKENASTEDRQALLTSWYREMIIPIVADHIKKYEPLLQVSVNEFRIKSMKTRWGTCNISDKRIWLNLHLIKMHPRCLEYVVVHEMVHLLERYHNKKFYCLVEKVMPDWEVYKEQLNHIDLNYLI